MKEAIQWNLVGALWVAIITTAWALAWALVPLVLVLLWIFYDMWTDIRDNKSPRKQTLTVGKDNEQS